MATNNNLIPINIKDLPKLDILTNTDLIPIETVQGTATILYRDFIIDEAHTTFAATLSASVTNAVALSAAVAATNATMSSVSATLNSSITALSSGIYTYADSISSNTVQLSTSVASLSTNLYALSSQTLSLSTSTAADIAAVSAAVVALNNTIVTTDSYSDVYTPTSSVGSKGLVVEMIFGTAGLIALSANSIYVAKCALYYTKSTQSLVSFGFSANDNFTRYVGKVMHGRFSGADTTFSPISGIMELSNTPATNMLFNATYLISDAQDQFAEIELTITTTAAITGGFTVSCGGGTIAPLLGSYVTLNKIN